MRPNPTQEPGDRVVILWRLQGVVTTGILAVPVGGVGAFLWVQLDSFWVLVVTALCVAALGLLNVFVAPYFLNRYWRYEVNRDEIYLQKGVFTINRTVVPLVRLEHVDTNQGPIERVFGVTTVRVHTAAGTHNFPPVAQEVAEEIRDLVAEWTREAKDA